MLSDHNEIKFEVVTERSLDILSLNIWKLNNTLLNNQRRNKKGS